MGLDHNLHNVMSVVGCLGCLKVSHSLQECFGKNSHAPRNSHILNCIPKGGQLEMETLAVLHCRLTLLSELPRKPLVSANPLPDGSSQP